MAARVHLPNQQVLIWTQEPTLPTYVDDDAAWQSAALTDQRSLSREASEITPILLPEDFCLFVETFAARHELSTEAVDELRIELQRLQTLREMEVDSGKVLRDRNAELEQLWQVHETALRASQRRAEQLFAQNWELARAVVQEREQCARLRQEMVEAQSAISIAPTRRTVNIIEPPVSPRGVTEEPSLPKREKSGGETLVRLKKWRSHLSRLRRLSRSTAISPTDVKENETKSVATAEDEVRFFTSSPRNAREPRDSRTISHTATSITSLPAPGPRTRTHPAHQQDGAALEFLVSSSSSSVIQSTPAMDRPAPRHTARDAAAAQSAVTDTDQHNPSPTPELKSVRQPQRLGGDEDEREVFPENAGQSGDIGPNSGCRLKRLKSRGRFGRGAFSLVPRASKWLLLVGAVRLIRPNAKLQDKQRGWDGATLPVKVDTGRETLEASLAEQRKQVEEFLDLTPQALFSIQET